MPFLQHIFVGMLLLFAAICQGAERVWLFDKPSSRVNFLSDLLMELLTIHCQATKSELINPQQLHQIQFIHFTLILSKSCKININSTISVLHGVELRAAIGYLLLFQQTTTLSYHLIVPFPSVIVKKSEYLSVQQAENLKMQTVVRKRFIPFSVCSILIFSKVKKGESRVLQYSS